MDSEVTGDKAQWNREVSGAKTLACRFFLRLSWQRASTDSKMFHSLPISPRPQASRSIGVPDRANGNTVTVKVGKPDSVEPTYDVVEMRASILCLSPQRSTSRSCEPPGGCAIGTRPIDIHLEDLKALGAEV